MDYAELETPAPSYGQSPPENSPKQGRRWRAGIWARFPILSFICLLLIIGATIAITVVLVTSDGKDVASWGVRNYTFAGHRKRLQISVSTWVSIFNFLTSKLLAVVFAEAVAISWWVDAMNGQTLHQLHFRWEVSQSLLYLFARKQLWGWICVASIAFTAFTALETLLQSASSTTTVLATIPSNMSAVLADALPAGFSGVIAAVGHDTFGVQYWTPTFVEVIQNYTAQSPIHLDLDGCAPTSNVSCATTLHGVGFQWDCTTGRSDLLDPIYERANDSAVIQSTNVVFSVDFTGENGAWAMNMSTLWQDRTSGGGLANVLANCNCTLIPAQVEYPVNVTQNVVTLQPANAALNMDKISAGVDTSSFLVDKVLSVLPMPAYDIPQQENPLSTAGTHSTLGGISLAFKSLFISEITLKEDITNFGADLEVSGTFAAPYAQFTLGTSNADYLNNTYSSPMPELLSKIRDIMFRSSLMVAQQNIQDYTWVGNSTGLDNRNGSVPIKTVVNPGTYNIYHTVYHTNRKMLAIGLSLMLVAVLAILPLFWGFWYLGREVTMSPLEIAKALQSGTEQQKTSQGNGVLDVKTAPIIGSNLPVAQLVKSLGDTRVRYGEVAPNVLGLGLSENTERARKGWRYQ